MVIDLKTGEVVHWLRLEGEVTELYDVQVLPGVRRPQALGFHTEEIQQLITLDPRSPLIEGNLPEVRASAIAYNPHSAP